MDRRPVRNRRINTNNEDKKFSNRVLLRLISSVLIGGVLFGVYFSPFPFRDGVVRTTEDFLNRTTKKEEVVSGFYMVLDYANKSKPVQFLKDKYTEVFSEKPEVNNNES